MNLNFIFLDISAKSKMVFVKVQFIISLELIYFQFLPFQILELTGYKLTNGADFKMFSVLAALSQRISALE